MACCSCLVGFYFKEKFCVSALEGEMFVLKTLSRKLYLRFYKSFIQMVKYSFPDERIVYRSFLNISIISKHLVYPVDKLHAHAALPRQRCATYMSADPKHRKQSGKTERFRSMFMLRVYTNVKQQIIELLLSAFTAVPNHTRPLTIFSSFENEFLVDINQMFP